MWAGNQDKEELQLQQCSNTSVLPHCSHYSEHISKAGLWVAAGEEIRKVPEPPLEDIEKGWRSWIRGQVRYEGSRGAR